MIIYIALESRSCGQNACRGRGIFNSAPFARWRRTVPGPFELEGSEIERKKGLGPKVFPMKRDVCVFVAKALAANESMGVRVTQTCST